MHNRWCLYEETTDLVKYAADAPRRIPQLIASLAAWKKKLSENRNMRYGYSLFAEPKPRYA
jgi:hypothetical protein